MKSFQKLNSELTSIRGTTVALIALAASFATPAIADNDYEGVRRGIERQKVEKPRGGQQAEHRPDRQVERRQERHADRQHDRIDRHQERRVHRAPAWRGDIRHFDRHDFPRWRGGAWRHARHEGRFGWWWVVGGSWYFYSQPVYPYPDPYIPPMVVTQSEPAEPAPTIIVAPAAASQSWYFCESANGYYPYTATCPEGWKSVPATPAPAQ